MSGILTFIGCFITELCLTAIGLGVILLFFSYFPLTGLDYDSSTKSYSYNNKRVVQRINDSLNDLYNKKICLDQEVFRLKREQIKLINQFEQGYNGQAISFSESKKDIKSEDNNSCYGTNKM